MSGSTPCNIPPRHAYIVPIVGPVLLPVTPPISLSIRFENAYGRCEKCGYEGLVVLVYVEGRDEPVRPGCERCLSDEAVRQAVKAMHEHKS
jgi:hypothetical protein